MRGSWERAAPITRHVVLYSVLIIDTYCPGHCVAACWISSDRASISSCGPFWAICGLSPLYVPPFFLKKKEIPCSKGPRTVISGSGVHMTCRKRPAGHVVTLLRQVHTYLR